MLLEGSGLFVVAVGEEDEGFVGPVVGVGEEDEGFVGPGTGGGEDAGAGSSVGDTVTVADEAGEPATSALVVSGECEPPRHPETRIRAIKAGGVL